MTDNYAKEFHEATAKEGDCWHEWITGVSPEIYLIVCKHCGEIYTDYNDNPTYDNPRDILNRMKEFCGEERYDEFIRWLQQTHWFEIDEFLETYILNPPALLKKAVEFMKGEGK